MTASAEVVSAGATLVGAAGSVVSEVVVTAALGETGGVVGSGAPLSAAHPAKNRIAAQATTSIRTFMFDP
ncbi:hypothetical protein RE9414_17420 [Prescottella equi]|nr:hypothetical protein RE9414_17420 [Prescottella equi]